MLILLLALVALIGLGLPVAYSLGLAALCFFVIEDPWLIQVLPQRVFSGLNSYTLISLPLFILMGLVMNQAGITQRLVSFSAFFVGRLQGGLALVNVLASMLFGGISGSSSSDTASIGSILIPEMERRGYPTRFASGITVASSTMGMIIPPSIPMVLYAVVSQESVGRLFLAGLIPGVLIGVVQLGIALLISKREGYPAEDNELSFARFFTEVRRSTLVLIMPVFIVGSVVFGVATATESAALGVFYAAVLGFFVLRLLTVVALVESLKTAVLISAKIMAIIAFSQAYMWVLALERIPEAIGGFVAGLGWAPIWTLLLVDVVILLAGTIIDVSPAILLLTPVFLPAVAEAGVSPVQFGVVLITGLAVGACTPPVGNCLNVCSAISGLGIGAIFRGAAPFLAANVTIMLLVTILPELSLWLPSLLME